MSRVHSRLLESTRTEANHLSTAAAFGSGGELLQRLLQERAIDASHGLVGGGDHVRERWYRICG